MTKHTPGPWSVGKYTITVDGPDGKILATITASTKDKELANARLIAAAPEMLDLLYAALPHVEDGEEFNKPQCRNLSKNIKELINKIEGKTND